MDLNLSEGLQIRAFQKYIFNSRKQEDNETIEDFANTLTRLGANIGAEEQTIVDRFIAGLKNDSARLGILQVCRFHTSNLLQQIYRGVFSTGAMVALAPAIFGHFITVSQGQHPQWKNSINTQHPQY